MAPQRHLPKLLILIPHLGGGGAERVATILAQHINTGHFEVHMGLLTPDAAGALPLPSTVLVHRFEASRVRASWLRLLRLIWSERPELILSGIAHLNFLVLLLRLVLPLRTRVLVRQNSVASDADSFWVRLSYRTLYRFATVVICQTEDMATDFAKHFGIPKRKLMVLANPLILSCRGRLGGGIPHNRHVLNLLCVARLSHEKGIDLLLCAFAELVTWCDNLRLIILGTGSEESGLRKLASELDIEDRVSFHGYVDPTAFYEEAAIFVSPSRKEGLPNAVLEAAAAGLPIVVTPSSSGLVDLLRGCPGTWIASDVSAFALANTLKQTIQALQALPIGKRRFDHTFVAPFKTPAAVEAYERVLIEACSSLAR